MVADGSTEPTALEPYEYDGLYRPEMVLRYLHVGLPAELRRPLSRGRLQGWITSGLIHARPEYGYRLGGNYILNFDDLVTAQAIVLFFEAGHSIQRIRVFERRCAELFKVDRPFAHREFWFARRDMLAELADNVFFSARHPKQLTFYREGMDRLSDKLEFSKKTMRANAWHPWPRIELRPDTQFGRSCVAGTSITTSTLWGFVEAGETVAKVAEAYGLEVKDVSDAVRFEHEVRSSLETATRVPA